MPRWISPRTGPRDLVRRYADAMERGDIDTLTGMLTQDAGGWVGGAELFGRAFPRRRHKEAATSSTS